MIRVHPATPSPAVDQPNDEPVPQTELERNASVISTASSSSSSSSVVAPPVRPRPIRTYTGPQARNVPDVAASSPTTPRQSIFQPNHLTITPGGSSLTLPGTVIGSFGSPSNDNSLITTNLSPSRSPQGASSPTGRRSRQPSGGQGAHNYIFGRVLGEGSYSTVFEASSVVNQQVYAIKIISKRHIQKENKVRYANSERAILSKLGSQNPPGIIRLWSAFQDSNSLYFVLQLAKNGDLHSFLYRLGSFDLTCTRYYGATILDALIFMHGMNIIHRDFKPENILLDENMRIKISDFGSAKDLSASSAPQSLDKPTSAKGSFVGTAEYASPELLTRTETGKHSDIWAFGCIIYYFMAGTLPFHGGTHYLLMQCIQKGDYTFPDGFDPVLKDLVAKILVLDPTQRYGSGPLGTEELRGHPFFNDIDWPSIWTIDPPTLQAGLVQKDQSQQNGNIDLSWADYVDSEDDGIEIAPKSTHAPELAGIAVHGEVFPVTRPEEQDFPPNADHSSQENRLEGLPPVETHTEPPVPDDEKPNSALPLPIMENPSSGGRSHPDTRSSASYSSSEALHETTTGSGTSVPGSSSKGFELVRGLRGLSVEEPSDWVLPNGQSLLRPSELVTQRTWITTRIKRGILPAKPKRRLLVLTSLPRLLCVKESLRGTKRKAIVQDEFTFESSSIASPAHLVTKVEFQIGETSSISIQTDEGKKFVYTLTLASSSQGNGANSLSKLVMDWNEKLVVLSAQIPNSFTVGMVASTS